ncbi:MAG: hypothetical protein M3Z98_10305 [Candidatus Dormibacteraeota bacterium]|nr:hypothetical protein [Candidatus Dormibacteraeota bacterium]
MVMAGAAVVVLLAACDAPFGLGSPTTRALESGAAGGLSNAGSFEVAGTYTESGKRWTIDLQVARPHTQHITASDGTVKLEAILIGAQAYFRGREFLTAHLGSDPASLSLVRATGDAWWKGSASAAPNLPDFTDGNRLRAAFLGSAVNRRTDHLAVDGSAAVELSGPRADIYIAEAAPYQLLRVHSKAGAAIDGVTAADLRFTNFDHDFAIVTPRDVIDFTNLSTLPPSYTVVSVDTSRCGIPCLAAADVKNLGGTQGARAPSTVTFKMTDTASGYVLGSCQARIQPDVGYNATATISCTISVSTSLSYNAATITATPDNPGRAGA